MVDWWPVLRCFVLEMVSCSMRGGSHVVNSYSKWWSSHHLVFHLYVSVELMFHSHDSMGMGLGAVLVCVMKRNVIC